jgi:hypothetical protein
MRNHLILSIGLAVILLGSDDASATETTPLKSMMAKWQHNIPTGICLGLDRFCADFLRVVRPLVARSNMNRHINTNESGKIVWHDSYAKAMTLAEQQNKMLLIYFCSGCRDEPCTRFKNDTLGDRKVCRKLRDYVCVQLSLDAKIMMGGKKVTLLEHPAYEEMLGRPGIAIVDFRSTDDKLRGKIVSMFPITDRLWYTSEQMAVILDLPAATLTQRTLIYAVRIHPEKPASSDGPLNTDLLDEAESHSQHQADILLQGHHAWESRFHRIMDKLGGLTPREVCAESWPGDRLVDAAIECVRCWRLSSGHWDAVRSPNQSFGYDMKLGSNGIWYATGIFGG